MCSFRLGTLGSGEEGGSQHSTGPMEDEHGGQSLQSSPGELPSKVVISECLGELQGCWRRREARQAGTLRLTEGA
jgi:hypothetical protein